jgi:hypothetical protein
VSPDYPNATIHLVGRECHVEYRQRNRRKRNRGTISAGGLYSPPAAGGTHIITATTVTAPPVSGSSTVAVSDLFAVLTYHNSPARNGINNKEYALTPTTLNTSTFGKLFS